MAKKWLFLCNVVVVWCIGVLYTCMVMTSAAGVLVWLEKPCICGRGMKCAFVRVMDRCDVAQYALASSEISVTCCGQYATIHVSQYFIMMYK